MAVMAKESTTHARVIVLDHFRKAQVMAMNEQLAMRAPGTDPEVPRNEDWTGLAGHEVLEFLDDDANGFDFALRELRAELAPATWLERLLVDQIVLSAGRLRASATEERLGRPSSEWGVSTLLAQISLGRAIERLTQLRTTPIPPPRRASRWRGSSPYEELSDSPSAPGSQPEDLENDVSWTDRHPSALPMGLADEKRFVQSGRSWRSRLVFDESISVDLPIVKGTHITTGRIASLVIDGQSWREILEIYPELIEEDIRACLAYTVEQDGIAELRSEVN
jgi:uncharacterized protein (DUF433 family)